MNRTESGAAKRMLTQVGNQLQDGRDPQEVLASAARHCDRLDLADKLLPVLLLAWLGAGLQQGRDLVEMVADAQVLVTLFAPEGSPR